jgi:hypothetical protein
MGGHYANINPEISTDLQDGRSRSRELNLGLPKHAARSANHS